jgi:YaiO family outer membrane protein
MHAVPVEPAAIVVQARTQSVYDSAVANRRAGRHPAALAGFQAVIDAEPANLDARLNLGLTLLALDRLDDAEAAFEGVLEVEPDYVDARVGLVQAARRRGDAAAARRQLDLAAAFAPDRKDVQALSAAIDAPLWRFDLDVSRSRLSHDLPDWSSERLGGARRLDERTAAGLSIERTERFGDEDVYLEGQLDREWGRASLFLAIGGAPGADYRAQRAVRIGGATPLGAGFAATIEAGAARYATGTVRNFQPGLTASMASARLVLAARWILVWDEQDRSRSGYAIRASAAFTDRSRVTLSYADAPETSEGVTVDVRATAIGLEVDLVERITARLTLVQEDRASYRRDEIAVGLGVRF